MAFKNILLLISVFKFAACQFCNQNEIFSPVINTCNSCGVRGWCPQEVGFGCDCFPGFLRNSLGVCGTPEECDLLPEGTCGPFEVYSECVNACNDCQTRGVPCNFLVCNKGCDCKPGYTRNEQRICIPENLCPRPPGPQCSLPKCPPGCSIDFTSQPCPSCRCEGTGPQCSPPKCPPGCSIDFTSQPCPSCRCEGTVCGRFEEYQSCGSACQATCDNPRPGPCTLQCVPGCFCISGYVRRGKTCVPLSQCRQRPQKIRPRGFKYPPAYPPSLRPAIPPPPPPAYPPPPPAYPPPPPVYPPPPPSPAYPRRLPTYPPPPPPPDYLPPLPPKFPPPRPPPSKFPPPKISPPGADSRGCPNRNQCNKYCRSIGQVVGFCVGDNFLKCNCLS